MKTLKESILSSTKTGKQKVLKDKIEEWCEKYKPFNGFYKINSNNEIETITGNELILDYIDYDELPEYIQFADNKNLTIYIGGDASSYSKRTIIRNIKSFRGLPKICYDLYFNNCHIKKLPKLEIKLNNCLFRAEIDEIDEIHLDFLDFQNTGVLDMRTLTFKENFTKSFKNIYVKNVEAIDIINDSYFSEEFSKAIGKKSRLNRSRNKYEFPVTEEDLDVINTFFGKTIDISNLVRINYTYNLKLVKYKGLWYRCKNL
jgi:hypothetical protein